MGRQASAPNGGLDTCGADPVAAGTIIDYTNIF